MSTEARPFSADWPQAAPAAGADRSIARRSLGQALKRARVAAGLTQDKAAGEFDWSKSKLLRHEGGDQGTTRVELHAMLRLYRVSAPGRVQELEALAEAGRRQPWWQEHAVLVPPRLGIWLAWEASAVRLQVCCPPYVPDLLQTADYAAMLLAATGVRPDRVPEHLALLAARQEHALGRPGARAEFLIHEATAGGLARGAPAMRRQLEHLAAVAAGEQAGVRIRIVPCAAYCADAAWKPFTLAHLPDRDAPALLGGTALAASAGVWGWELHDGPVPRGGPDVTAIFGRAAAAALTPADSAAYLAGRRVPSMTLPVSGL